MFRHERPQKGRFRQFHQFNLEVIGSDKISEDAQCLKMLDSLFTNFGINEYAIMINFLGTSEERKAYTEKLNKHLDTIVDKICKTCLVRKDKNIMRVFDCKNETCQSLYNDAPKIVDNLGTESEKEWKQLQEQLDLLSVSYTVNPKLVRGLDYYSKTVFEFVSPNLGSQSSFCAGGRYNNLVKAVGGKQDQPSIGASIGIERLVMVLEPIKDTLSLPHPAALTVIIPLSEEQHTLALLISEDLHAQKITNDVLFEGSVKSMMRKANKMGATFTVLIGADEQESRTATVKNMINSTEKNMDQTKLAQYLKKV